MKKNKGFIEDMIIPLIALVIAMVLILMNSNATKTMITKQKVDIVARQYILKMETDGYLMSNEEDSLIKELNKIGLQNVSLNGTTKTNVGYGKEINLNISGYITTKELKVVNLGLEKKEKSIPIHVEEVSTSKS